MKAIAIDIGAREPVWNRRETDGALVQRAAVTVMTAVGTDQTLPDRGTELQSRLSSVRAVDAMGLQHQLNFAALAVRRSVRDNEEPDLPESDRIGRVEFRLRSFKDADLTVYDAGGDKRTLTHRL